MLTPPSLAQRPRTEELAAHIGQLFASDIEPPRFFRVLIVLAQIVGSLDTH
jgi:hypothetical protein